MWRVGAKWVPFCPHCPLTNLIGVEQRAARQLLRLSLDPPPSLEAEAGRTDMGLGLLRVDSSLSSFSPSLHPPSPCCAMLAVHPWAPESWRKTGGSLGERVRLSVWFLLGAAALYQLEVDNISTDSIVSLGYNQWTSAYVEVSTLLFSRLNKPQLFQSPPSFPPPPMSSFLPKFKLLYRFPNKPYKLCLVKIRLGQQSKLGLLSIGKSNKEQSTNQEGKCTVHANTAQLLEKEPVLDDEVKTWQHQSFHWHNRWMGQSGKGASPGHMHIPSVAPSSMPQSVCLPYNEA